MKRVKRPELRLHGQKVRLKKKPVILAVSVLVLIVLLVSVSVHAASKKHTQKVSAGVAEETAAAVEETTAAEEKLSEEETTTAEEETTQEETSGEEETASSQVVWYAWDGTDKVQCDSTEFAELTDEILKISASNAVDYNAGSAEKLSETYGIADRMITVNYVDADTDEDKSYTLHFGSSDGAGNVYMTVDDSMQVQLVEESMVNSIFGGGN